MQLKRDERADIEMGLRKLTCAACGHEWVPDRCWRCEKDCEINDTECSTCSTVLPTNPFRCRACGSLDSVPFELDDFFSEADRPVRLWPALQPIVDSLNEMGKDANGSSLFTEKIAWLGLNEVTARDEVNTWRFLWMQYEGAAQKAIADSMPQAGDKKDEE